jgi:hypothetical protein
MENEKRVHVNITVSAPLGSRIYLNDLDMTVTDGSEEESEEENVYWVIRGEESEIHSN